jgi:hypothetical protein
MLFNLQDLPHIPIYPVATLYDLPALLADLRKPFGQHPHKATPASPLTALDLLQRCTANPPMALQTAYYLSDLFVNLADLAGACTGDVGLENHSEGGIGDATSAGQIEDDRMAQLRDLVGNDEFHNLVDFWTEEWIAE